MSVRQFLSRPPFCLRNLTAEQLSVFCTALTHDSFANEARDADPGSGVQSYERLEFLGDAIVEFLACEHAYGDGRLATEGELTDVKIATVRNSNLSQRVLESGMDIDGILRVGHGHLSKDGTRSISADMRADAFEALVAATYLCFGMDTAREIVRKAILPYRCGPRLSEGRRPVAC